MKRIYLNYLSAKLATAILFTPLCAQASEDYTFISGSDIYTALSQESFLVQGYLLGVADALKHDTQRADCFTVPLQPDADEALYRAYLNYWQKREPITRGTDAIREALHENFPC